MRGRLGLGLVALGIFVGVMGGFLLNAETETTCETSWTYVAEVSGAFEGPRADIDEEYSPPSNATGWSVDDAFNGGRISGVDWKEATATNLYRVTLGAEATSQGSLSVSCDDPDGTSRSPQATVTESGGGRMWNGDMPEGSGLHNPEAVTFYSHGGGMEPGAFYIPVSLLLSCVTGYSGSDTVSLSVPSAGGYPAFARLSKSYSVMVYRPYGGSYNVAAMLLEAAASGDGCTVHRVEGRCDIGGVSVPLSEAFLVWGRAQFNGSGAAEASVQVSFAMRMAAPTAYLDPSAGVLPTTGDLMTSTVQAVHHPGSPSPSLRFEFDALDTAGIRVTTSVVFDEGSTWASAASFYVSFGSSTWLLGISGSSSAPSSQPYEGGKAVVEVSITESQVTIKAGGTEVYSAASAYPLPGAIPASLSVKAVGLNGSTIPPFESTAVRADGSGDLHAFSGGAGPEEWDADLSYTAYEAVETTRHYDRAYWRNGYDNASVSLLLRQTDPAASQHASLTFYGPSDSETIEVRYDPSSGWTAGGKAVGAWEAVLLTAGYGSIDARPVQRFGSFTDFEAIDRPVEVSAFDGTVTGILSPASQPGEGLRMAVSSTVTRIAQGGLFLQDAELSLARSFPDAGMASLSIGSAARAGSSLTFASESAGSSASLPVDAEGMRVYVGGAWRPLSSVAFRWASSSAGSETVGGVSYGPAIYVRGQAYAADTVWAETADGRMHEVAKAGSDWTVTLDGVWAPTVSLYGGQNEAAERTVLADVSKPSWGWDKDALLVCMMAVSVLGGIVGSHFGRADAWDWLAIVGTIGALWLFLGRSD